MTPIVQSGGVETSAPFAGAPASEAARVPSPFVGRSSERTLLRDLKDLAWDGHGQAVLITGEAGIGKSRLLQWLGDAVANQPHTVRRFQCTQHHRDSPLYPFVTELAASAEIERDAPAPEKLDRLEALMTAREPDSVDYAFLLAERLSVPTGTRYGSSDAGPVERRRKTLDLMLDLAVAGARSKPLLLVFEDAHWADATSRELLGRMLERIRDLPVLLLVTCRPEFALRWAHGGNLTTLVVERLDQRQVRTLVAQMSRDNPLPAHVLDEIAAKSDGVPLYAEELTRSVRESESKCEAWQTSSDPFADSITIPATLQDTLSVRLDRLPNAKGIAQIGASIGREFSRDLLALVAGVGDAEIDSALIELEGADLVARRGRAPNAVYTFKHALLQDAASTSITPERRRAIHGDLAEAIVAKRPGLAAAEPETVARHFAEAENASKAADWWTKAGDNALRRSAFEEAYGHYRKAASLLDAGETATNVPKRLKLQVSLGQSLTSFRGFAAPETIAAFEAAQQLAASVADANERLGIYYGLWMGSVTAGVGAPMLKWAGAFLDEAKARDSATERGVGHRMLGNTLFFAGDFAAAKAHLEQAITLSGPDPELAVAFRYNVHQRAASKINLAMVLAPMGHRVEALQLADEAVAEAMATKHFTSIAFVLGHRFTFEAISDDPAGCQNVVRDMQALSQSFKVPLWQAWVDLFEGWIRFRSGDHAGGVEQHRAGLAFFGGQGIGRFHPLSQLMLAQADALVDPGRAVASIDAQLSQMDDAGERWFHAELHRHRGLLLAQRSTPNGADVRAALDAAVHVATDQGASAFGLRALLSKARFETHGERAVIARTALQDAVDRFAGQSARELGEAQTFLANAHDESSR